MKNQKTALFTSFVSLLLCMAMLVGTTFAWFTDSVTIKGNKIAAGDLKIELYQAKQDSKGAVAYTDAGEITWENITNESDPLFDYDNWEPNYTAYVVLKVVNKGTLALNWKATLTSEKTLGKLADKINVYAFPVENATAGTKTPVVPETRESATVASNKVGTLKQFLDGLETKTYGTLKEGEEAYLTLVLQMDPDTTNDYQKEKLSGEFDICIVATQAPVESDSFGSDYDKDSKYCEHKEFNADGTCKECGAYVREKDATGSTTTPDPNQPTTPDTPDTPTTAMTLSFASTGTTATGVDSSKVTVTGDAEYGTYVGRTNAVALDNDDDITVDITSLYNDIKDGFTVSYWVSNQKESTDAKTGWSLFIYNPYNFGTQAIERKYIGLMHTDKTLIKLERGDKNAPGDEDAHYGSPWGEKRIDEANMNKWTHIAFSFEAKKATVYLNGEKAFEVDSTYIDISELLNENNLVLAINKAQWSDGEHLNAYYSDFAIYDKALSADEVTTIYNAQK